MFGIIRDLYQSHRISELEDRIGSVQVSRGTDGVARDVAFRLEEQVDRVALICCAMFELMQETSGISEEQRRRGRVRLTRQRRR